MGLDRLTKQRVREGIAERLASPPSRDSRRVRRGTPYIPEFRRFELKEDMEEYSAEAYLLRRDADGELEKTDIEFIVCDPFEKWNGKEEDRGVARKVIDGDYWEVIDSSSSGRRITGYLTEDLETTDSTFTIDGVSAVCGTSPVEETSDTVTIYNTHNWEGDEDALVRAEWHDENGRWEAYNVDCPD